MTPVKVPDLNVDQGLQPQSEVQRAEQAKNEPIPLFFSRAAGRRRRGIHAIAATLDMKISITPFGSGYKGGVRVGRLCQRGNAQTVTFYRPISKSRSRGNEMEKESHGWG